MVPTANAALQYHFPQQLFLATDQWVQNCLIPAWPLQDLYHKVIPDTLQKYPEDLMSHCISLTAKFREVEVHQENRGG